MDRLPGHRPEPRLRLVLYQSLVKGERFDWVLEKGTEVGVAAFVPLLSQRSVMRPASGRSERPGRWHRVVREAAEQCGRSVLPELLPAHIGDRITLNPALLWRLRRGAEALEER